MTEDTSDQKIIRRLQELQIEEARLLHILEEHAEQRTRSQELKARARAATAASSRRREEDVRTNPYEVVIESRRHPYKRGDRVYITNSVNTTAHGGPANAKDRRATVLSVVADTVTIKTDNSLETWRLAKNLKYLKEAKMAYK